MCKQEKFPTTLQRKSYSLSEKQSLLELYFQSGINCRQFAIQHGLEYKTLWNWVSSCKSAEKNVPLHSRLVSKCKRDVAQPGSATVWGTGGRKFKSCHPDNKEITTSFRSGYFIYPKSPTLSDEFFLLCVQSKKRPLNV